MIEFLIVIGIIVIAIFLTGCKKPIKPKITEILLDVPYEKYAGKNYCLVASATMIFKYYGENISQSQIANKIIVNGDISTFRLVSYARELGYSAEWEIRSIEEIEEYLKGKNPLIVIQKYSLNIKNSHARVITGFDSIKRELTLHDSVDKNNYKMGYKEFFDLSFYSSEKTQIIIIRR